MCRITRFLLRGGGTRRRVEASCRPVRCAAAGCLLSATACQNRNQGIHPSSPSPCSGQTCQWMAGGNGESLWDNQPNSTGRENRPPSSVRSHGALLLSTAFVHAGSPALCRPSGRIRQYENSCRTGSPSHSWLFGGTRFTTPLPLPTRFPFLRSIGFHLRLLFSWAQGCLFTSGSVFGPIPCKHSHERVRVRCGMKSDLGGGFISSLDGRPLPRAARPHSRPLMAARLRHGGGRNWVYSNRRRRGHDLEPHGTLALIPPRRP